MTRIVVMFLSIYWTEFGYRLILCQKLNNLQLTAPQVTWYMSDSRTNWFHEFLGGFRGFQVKPRSCPYFLFESMLPDSIRVGYTRVQALSPISLKNVHVHVLDVSISWVTSLNFALLFFFFWISPVRQLSPPTGLSNIISTVLWPLPVSPSKNTNENVL